MKKYISLLKYEFKMILKDSMSIFMIVYPILMLFICGFLLPAILDKTSTQDSNGTTITLLIGFVVILSLGGFVMGALLGFSLLENKDENTLINIAVTPVTVSGYAMFKVAYTYVLAFFGNVFMIGGLKLIATDKYQVVYLSQTVNLLDNISYGQIIIFSLVASLVIPTIAMIIGAIAKNKIEGFAFMKSSGIIIMVPLLTLLDTFKDAKQYILGIVPNFWTVKALLNISLSSTNPSDLSYGMYLLIGAVYTIFLGGICLRFFIKKSNLK
ncbi:MAG: hypothetical protein KJ971_06445 [Firmicutes bacterium]|nr:hypothetical protein [Bacillota bacterium]